MLLESLDDPAFARALARRLHLPVAPIRGANPDPVTTPGGTAPYLPRFSSSTEIVDSMVYQDTTNSRIGIGTSSPQAKFHVAGSSQELARFGGSSGAASWLTLYEASTLRSYLGFESGGGSLLMGGLAGATVLRSASNPVHVASGASATSGITIDTGGKVGIGTTSPASLLHAAGSNTGSGLVRIQNTGGNQGDVNGIDFRHYSDGRLQAYIRDEIGSGWPTKLHFGTASGVDNAATRMTIDNNGNVGIGTTSPKRPLHVKGGDAVVEGGGLGLIDASKNDPTTVLYKGGSDITILRTYDVGQTPTPNATLLNIWAPPEGQSFPTDDREATITLQRATNNEDYAEYLDLYNNYYDDEKQYGIRIQKRNPMGQTNAQYRDFVIDQFDGTDHTTLMALKVNGNVGIGTLTPQTSLDVAGQARVKPVTVSALPAASSAIEGAIAAVTDSNTNTWGATISGGGSNHVLAYCNGTNWTVAGK